MSPRRELDVVEAQFGRVLPGPVDHRRREVNANDTAVRAHLPGGQEAVQPRAASQIEHRLAASHTGQGHRMSGPEADYAAGHLPQDSYWVGTIAGWRATAFRCIATGARGLKPVGVRFRDELFDRRR